MKKNCITRLWYWYHGYYVTDVENCFMKFPVLVLVTWVAKVTYCIVLHCPLTSQALSVNILRTPSMANLYQIWYVTCHICMVRRQKKIDFMTLTQRGDNFRVKTVKLMKFEKKILGIDQMNWEPVMMPNEDSTKIVNFMTHGAGVLVLGRDHTSYMYILKMHLFF